MASGSLPRVGDLEIDEDVRFQRWEWHVERIGWIAFVLLLTAALLGLFGPGLFTTAQRGGQDELLSVEYQRFTRFGYSTPLHVRVAPAAVTAGEVRIAFDRQYLQEATIEAISPEPKSVEARGEELVFVFAVADGGEAVTATFHLALETVGPLSGRISLPDGTARDFDQFIYP